MSSFFFHDSPPSEIYTLSLHDALPIYNVREFQLAGSHLASDARGIRDSADRECRARDRKSTRLNSSHVSISYAVFCLKKKKSFGAINFEHIRPYVDDIVTVT